MKVPNSMVTRTRVSGHKKAREVLSAHSRTVSSTTDCRVGHHQKPKGGRKSVKTPKDKKDLRVE